MANQRIGNILYVDDASSQVDLQIANVKIKKVILTNAATKINVTLVISDYDSTSPRKVMELQITSTEGTKVFDFTENPLALPNGLSIPSTGLTSNAKATIIYEGQ